MLGAGPVKLPPDFDLQSQNAATEWKFWQTAFQDYLVSTGQDEANSNVKLSILRNIIGHDEPELCPHLPLTLILTNIRCNVGRN